MLNPFKEHPQVIPPALSPSSGSFLCVEETGSIGRVQLRQRRCTTADSTLFFGRLEPVPLQEASHLPFEASQRVEVKESR